MFSEEYRSHFLIVIPSRSEPRSRGESERGICSFLNG